MPAEEAQEEFQISVHALSGVQLYRTMRLQGQIKKNMVEILVDSGSTHNFLDPVFAKRTGTMIHPTSPMTVIVAYGTKLISKAMVKNFHWVMNGTDFHTDLRLLPLGGCDMVLGVQWLSTLGLVLWDFQHLQMEFTAFGKKTCVSRRCYSCGADCGCKADEPPDQEATTRCHGPSMQFTSTEYHRGTP